jgi:hypothetical protein
MSTSNEKGTPASRKRCMDAYDRLPKTLRRELANAVRNWDATWFRNARSGGMHCRDCIDIIRQDEDESRSQ